MACNLTSGYTRGCRDAVAGIKEIYITELANKSSITTASGVITAFTLTTGKKFFTYELIRETANWTEDGDASRENGTRVYNQKLQIKLHKRSSTLNEELKLVLANECMVICKDQNGDYWLLGEINGMTIEKVAFASGTAMGDFNGYTIDATGAEVAPASKVTSSLMTTLLLPA